MNLGETLTSCGLKGVFWCGSILIQTACAQCLHSSRGWGWSWVWGRPRPCPVAGTLLGQDLIQVAGGKGQAGWLRSLWVCVLPSPCVGSLAPELGSTDHSGAHVEPLQPEVWAVCPPELHLFPCSAHTQSHTHGPLAPHGPSPHPASTSCLSWGHLQGPWGLRGVFVYILRELWGKGCHQSSRLLLTRHLSKCQPWLLPTPMLCPRPGCPWTLCSATPSCWRMWSRGRCTPRQGTWQPLEHLSNCPLCPALLAGVHKLVHKLAHTQIHTHSLPLSHSPPASYTCPPVSQGRFISPGYDPRPAASPEALTVHSPGCISAPVFSLFSPLSGAQVLTWSLFFLSYPITCGSLSQPWLYRSFSASFQWDLFHI